MSAANLAEAEQPPQETEIAQAPNEPGVAQPADELEAAQTGGAQALDFSAPTKFTAELRRRVGRVLTPFCKALSTRLSADLRAHVEVREVDAHQLSWAAARGELPEESMLVAVDAKPIDRQMLLSFDLPLMLRCLDCLLGGSVAETIESRKLSEIDWAIAHRLLDSIVLQLSLVWRDLGGLQLSVRDLDLEGDAGVLVPISEPTFAVTFAIEIAGLASNFSLLLPWSAIEPVAEEILSDGHPSQQANPSEASAMQRGLAAAKVELRAEIGAVDMPVEQVLMLEPSQLLRLDARAEHGVSLLAENVPLAFGLPGRSGVRRAIKLTTPIEPADALTAGSPQVAAPVPSTTGETTVGETREMLHGLARLRGVDVRVWAELGRTHMSLGDALRLPQGVVVELDQGAEDPVDLFVNGLRFASGTLAVTGEGDWAIEIGALL